MVRNITFNFDVLHIVLGQIVRNITFNFDVLHIVLGQIQSRIDDPCSIYLRRG